MVLIFFLKLFYISQFFCDKYVSLCHQKMIVFKHVLLNLMRETRKGVSCFPELAHWRYCIRHHFRESTPGPHYTALSLETRGVSHRWVKTALTVWPVRKIRRKGKGCSYFLPLHCSIKVNKSDQFKPYL